MKHLDEKNLDPESDSGEGLNPDIEQALGVVGKMVGQSRSQLLLRLALSGKDLSFILEIPGLLTRYAQDLEAKRAESVGRTAKRRKRFEEEKGVPARTGKRERFKLQWS